MSFFCKLFVSLPKPVVIDRMYVPAPYPEVVDYKPLLDEMGRTPDLTVKINLLIKWVTSNLSKGWLLIKDAFHRAVSSVFDFLAKFFLSYDPSAPKELIKRTYRGTSPTLSFFQQFLLRLRTRIDPDSPLLVDVFFRALVGAKFLRTDDAEFASAIFMSLKEAAGSWRGLTWQGVKLAARGVKSSFHQGLSHGIRREARALATVAVCAQLALPAPARTFIIQLGYNRPYLMRASLSVVQAGVSLLQTAAKAHSSNSRRVQAINEKATGLLRGACHNFGQGLQSAMASLRPVPLFAPLVLSLALQSANANRSTPSRLAFATSAVFLGTLTTWQSALWVLYLSLMISSPSVFLLALINYLSLESLETIARAYCTYTTRRAASN